jgi:hypothetical protein
MLAFPALSGVLVPDGFRSLLFLDLLDLLLFFAHGLLGQFRGCGLLYRGMDHLGVATFWA